MCAKSLDQGFAPTIKVNSFTGRSETHRVVRKLITAHAVCVAAFVLGQFPQTVGASEGIVPHGGRAYVNWGTPGPTSANYTRFSQTITPLEISPARAYNYFASQHFLHLPGGRSAFVPTKCYKNNGTSEPCPESGFYFGVQPSGIREDGRSEGPVALFSMWNASSATAGSESTCGRFDWEGMGYFCRLDLDSIAGENAFVVERSNDGKSWRTTIRQAGGQEKVIGTHTFPEVVEATGANSWLEYYGPPTTCGSVPNGWARYTFPEITTMDGTVRKMQIFSTTTTTCPTAKVLTNVSCDGVILGEGPPLANPPGICSARYDGNSPSSGSVPTDSTIYANGEAVTVLGNTGSLAKTGYSFDGWCTTQPAAGAACGGTARAAASTFAISADTKLYAVWKAEVPRQVGKSCTKVKSVRKTPSGRLICTRTRQGLVWQLGK